jgi:hypothetical protein
LTACLSFFIAINQLTILSSAAVVAGLYFFFTGFRLLARKRLLLTTPTSRIRSAALGLVEVSGVASGPHTMPAPITGQPCFLYHTTAWQQRQGKKGEWEKVADETMHLPFFIDDSTGQLLIEPLGANLDLHRDFREEYASSLFSSSLNEIPPRVSVFLSRLGIVPSRQLRIEERSIKPADPLFIAGTLMENPGVQVRPLSLRNDSPPSANNRRDQFPAPQIIKLSSGAPPAAIQDMSQQAKIAAALTRAGINRPEAWAAAGVPYRTVAIEENAPESAVNPLNGNGSKPSDFDLSPPVVLMKGENNPTFVISYRSQQEFVSALARKSAAMIWGGAAATLTGLYLLLVQMKMAWV